MRITQTLIVLGLLVAMHIPSSAQDHKTEKWQPVDLSFRTKINVSQPLDIIFGAIIKHENGQSMAVPGFWNDNKEFVIRFCPSLEGTWTYQTHSSVPELSGKEGKIQVSPTTKMDRKGAIHVSKRYKQRFEHEDGSSYFPLAFEIDWLFAIDAENKSDIPRTRQIVDELIRHRFNKVIMNVYAYDAPWGEKDKIDPQYNFAQPNIFPFGGTNESPDHSTLNIDFFKHLDRVMAHLHENEIVSHLMIYVWNKMVSWPKPGSENDNRYFDYVIKRYQAYPNLVWDISKEALAYGMNDLDYIIERIERVRRLDGHKRLVTVHDYDFCRYHPDKVDFISIQEWRPNLYNEMLEVIERHPDKPVFNVEHGAYEKTMHNIFHGAYVAPDIALERTYTCIFAGSYSTYYWQNTSWYELVYDPFSLPEINQPHFEYYKILMDFFDDYDFNELVPDQYFYSPFCLTDNKKTFIYLMPRGAYALEGIPAKQVHGKNVEIHWLNPLTGETTPVERRKMGSWTGIRKPASVDSPFSLVVIQVVE